MGTEVDLMRSYPKVDRAELINIRSKVTDLDREIARKFDSEYFDGPRKLGLGGYFYNPRFF